MMTPILLVLLGLALLVTGGELLVRGASRVAQLAGVSPAVVGLTVVAAGTSMPELVVSVKAALAGSPALAVTNVVGSNTFNIGVILGLAALVAPLRIRGKTVRMEWPLMLLSACLLHLLARDGLVDRLEGGFFLLGLALFVVYSVKLARGDVQPAEAEQFAAELPAARPPSGRTWALAALAIVAGCGLLAAGAESLVDGAVELAATAGASDAVIGLTIVAAGTSLPELVTSLVASHRGHDDVAVTNVIGSNVFNVLGILGASALIQPLDVGAAVLQRDSPWMLALSLALFPLMRSGFRVSRLEGALLLGAYAAYMVVLLG